MEVSARIVVAAPVRLLVGWDGTPSSQAIRPRDPEPNPTAARWRMQLPGASVIASISAVMQLGAYRVTIFCEYASI